jgi:hypothetical protein
MGSFGPGGNGGPQYANVGNHGKLHEITQTIQAPSQVGESGKVFTTGEETGAPDQAAPASVPYTAVYPAYSKAAEKALSGEKVPPAYRRRVKDYFNSLK